ncbi:MAG: hypothetical protein HYW47_08025 [Deltaproteobacteria bacterium]|nr:hypothetical protein [Deltaproteobacteria bacterium]
MKKVFVLLTLLGLVLTPYLTKAGPKEDQKKAADTDLEVTTYATSAAIAAAAAGAETLAAMFAGQALSSGVSYLQNKRGVKKFNDGNLYNPNGNLDLNDPALAQLQTLPNHLRNTNGRMPASDEEIKEEMESFIDKLEDMDQIDTAFNKISKEELIDSLKAGLTDEEENKNNLSQDSESDTSYNPQFRLTSSGPSGGNDFDYSEMLSSMFGNQEKSINENYVGNIPTRYLAQDEGLSIWNRISLKTRKLLK